MKVSIILAHPNEKSFNHAIAKTAIEQLELNGHEVFYHDLHRERFDPILPAEEIPSGAVLPDVIAEHCKEIASVDGIVIVHPNWWGQPPAILKGWIDRVWVNGVAWTLPDGANRLRPGLRNVRRYGGAFYRSTRGPREEAACSHHLRLARRSATRSRLAERGI